MTRDDTNLTHETYLVVRGAHFVVRPPQLVRHRVLDGGREVRRLAEVVRRLALARALLHHRLGRASRDTVNVLAVIVVIVCCVEVRDNGQRNTEYDKKFM